jgi:putative FmdB family regulatory protein
MPIYEMGCSNCNHKTEEYRQMSASGPAELCPNCGDITYTRQVSRPHSDMVSFSTPIEMFSIAMDTPEEVRAFARRCPDVDIETNEDHPMFGVPVARNRKAKLQALAVAGYMESNPHCGH